MDAKFHPTIAAIKSGDVDRLRALIQADATLATSRSSTSHPTLLQCLVLEGADAPNQLEMASILIDAGADVNGPLLVCASCDNVAAATLLLDRGAAINSSGGWSPVEEALYWNSQGVIHLLLQRGASIHNRRIAAGLGRTDAMETFLCCGQDHEVECALQYVGLGGRASFGHCRGVSDRPRGNEFGDWPGADEGTVRAGEAPASRFARAGTGMLAARSSVLSSDVRAGPSSRTSPAVR